MPDGPPFTWTVLGAGSILPRAGFGPAGYALRAAGERRVTLFDCGPGTVRALGSTGIALAEVHRVVISHFHPDHCLDLFALAFARRNPDSGCGPIELVGPRGLSDLLERGANTFGTRGWARFEDATVVEVDPAASNRVLALDGLALAFVPTLHAPEALAWRAELGGASVTYSGDTGETPAVAELASETDLFVCECSFADERAVEHHLTPSGAGRLARRARVRKLVLTHFYPDLAPEDARAVAARSFDGPIELARDGSVHLPARHP